MRLQRKGVEENDGQAPEKNILIQGVGIGAPAPPRRPP